MKKVFIIAEIAQAHDGSLGILHSYIDAVSKTGVNAIKFQIHIAHAESSIFEPFRVNFSYEDKTRYDYWKRMEFTFAQWEEIKKHCDDVSLEFLASPFSLAAVDLLEDIGVNKYKIGSGEVSNHLLLNKIAKTNKPVFLSSGMSSFVELDEAVNFFKDNSNELVLMQCTTEYPTAPETWGLNVILDLKKRYNLPVGFSDHSGDIFACLAAVALGAEVFEFHVTFHKKLFGPDSLASVEIDIVKRLTDGINQIKKSLESPIDKNDISKFVNVKNIFEKSIAINRDMKKGEVISENDLETKKPRGKGILASKYIDVIGKKVKRDLKAWDFIKKEDIYD
jgi:N,N'-diacetyllegionaminate synthase